ncbi:unnamed protein product [Amoebophrya sp. A120]|nr:unnamed protein product [Amoebophrya sp. A120]|eukprot:GSA120T00016408001.1
MTTAPTAGRGRECSRSSRLQCIDFDSSCKNCMFVASTRRTAAVSVAPLSTREPQGMLQIEMIFVDLNDYVLLEVGSKLFGCIVDSRLLLVQQMNLYELIYLITILQLLTFRPRRAAAAKNDI